MIDTKQIGRCLRLKEILWDERTFLDLDHGSDHTLYTDTTIQQTGYLKSLMLAAYKLCLNKQKRETKTCVRKIVFLHRVGT